MTEQKKIIIRERKFLYTRYIGIKKLHLLIGKQKTEEKNILFDVVFTQDNMDVPNQILSTIHLTASTTPNTNHIISSAHCTQ
jgi:hypothetical protein